MLNFGPENSLNRYNKDFNCKKIVGLFYCFDIRRGNKRLLPRLHLWEPHDNKAASRVQYCKISRVAESLYLRWPRCPTCTRLPGICGARWSPGPRTGPRLYELEASHFCVAQCRSVVSLQSLCASVAVSPRPQVKSPAPASDSNIRMELKWNNNSHTRNGR